MQFKCTNTSRLSALNLEFRWHQFRLSSAFMRFIVLTLVALKSETPAFFKCLEVHLLEIL